MKHPDMKDKRPKQVREAAGAAKTKAFDIWLNRGLHQIYDDVANEPIPEDLLKLIEDDKSK